MKDKPSFNDTQRLLARKHQIADDMMYYIEKGFRESEEQLRSEVNRKLYEMAESAKMSLWDLCFQVVPRMRAVDPKTKDSKDLEALRFESEYEVVLEPLPLEFEKGPDYWEFKYNRLKASIKKLIEDADNA